MLTLKRCPSGVNHKRGQHGENERGAYPPRVAAVGVAEAGEGCGDVCVGHRLVLNFIYLRLESLP